MRHCSAYPAYLGDPHHRHQMGLLTVILAIWVHAKPGAEEESTRFWELRGDATQRTPRQAG